MMDAGDINALLTVVRTKRPEWDVRSIRSQIEALAGGEHTHADIAWVCVTVAENLNNQFPVMLTSIGPKLIAKLHEKTGHNRTWTGSAGRRDDGFLCDICSKIERDCQSAATNLDGSDHMFKSIRYAEQERERERAAQNPETAANKQAAREVSRAWTTRLVEEKADLDEHYQSNPEQESA